MGVGAVGGQLHSKLHEGQPWSAGGGGLGHGPQPDLFSHSGLQPITMPGNQVKMKSMFNEENRAGGEGIRVD